MHFYELIKELTKNEETDIYVDMDGVIASYEFGKPLDFKNKRPLKTNIETIKKVSLLNNITVHILSVCREDYQINQKQEWLDKYASFFKKENRNILSKETFTNETSSELKSKFLNKLERNKKIILIDDDNKVLEVVRKNNPDIILLQDSELVD